MEGTPPPRPSAHRGMLLVVCDDVFFRVKVVETAWRGGWECDQAGSESALARSLSSPPPPVRAAVVDLMTKFLSATEVIRQIHKQWPDLPIVVFGPHTDAAGLEAARRAGAALAIPRSRFVREFPALLDPLLEPPSANAL